MYTAISVLIFIICVLLILIVLVQNSKGGGLASSFASSNQIMGVRKTTDFLEKATWTLAGGMMILCVLATFFIPRGENAVKSAKSKLSLFSNNPPRLSRPIREPAKMPRKQELQHPENNSIKT